MKVLFIIFSLLFSQIAFAQTGQKFDPIFIVNQEIVSQEKVEEYAEKGLIKKMSNGVSDEQFIELKKIHGDELIAKEFIMLIEIYTESEIQNRTPQSPMPKSNKVKSKVEDDYLLDIGDEAVDFTVDMINGEKIKLSELRGKVVHLNFWATWCAPCIREFYEIPSKVLDEFKNEDFIFLPIAIGEEKEIVEKKMSSLKEKGIEFNSGFDPDKTIWDQYAKGAIPKNLIIDKNGLIKYLSSGNDGNSVNEIQKEIRKLFQK